MTRETTSQSIVQGRTYGAFRCLNCFERISPPEGAKTYKCPHCSFEWRVSWPHPDVPRIRGPVWDTNKQMAEEATAKQRRENK